MQLPHEKNIAHRLCYNGCEIAVTQDLDARAQYDCTIFEYTHLCAMLACNLVCAIFDTLKCTEVC